jgi:hypothetical protein
MIGRVWSLPRRGDYTSTEITREAAERRFDYCRAWYSGEYRRVKVDSSKHGQSGRSDSNNRR